MSTTRLPELPEARIESYQTDGTMRTTKLTTYDEFDMHAYGLAVWKAAMEAAAKALEVAGLEVLGTILLPDDSLSEVPALKAAMAVVNAGAAAIRSLPLPEQGSPQ